MKLKDIKSKAKSYLNTKALAGIAALLLCVVIYTVVDLRSKLIDTRSKLESAQLLNNIIDKEQHRLDSLVIAYKAAVAKRDALIASKDNKINKQLHEIDMLEDSIKSSLVDVTNVTADSSYKYLMFRMPPITELKFPFDSSQVKKIHYTFSEMDGLLFINSKLDSTILEFKFTSGLKDKQINDLKQLNSTYVSREVILRKQTEAYKIEVTGLNKTVKKQKFLKTVSTVAAIGLAGYIIVQ